MKTKYVYTFTVFTDRDSFDDVAVGTIDDIAKTQDLHKVFHVGRYGGVEELDVKRIISRGKPEILVLIDGDGRIVESNY